MCVNSPLVPIKSYKQRKIAAFYYDPRGPAEAPRWRRSDICLDITAYYIRVGQGSLPLVKKEYRDPEAYVDPHLDIFRVPKPFVGGGSKKGKSRGPTVAADQVGPPTKGLVKRRRRLKKKKKDDISSFQSWEGDDLPLLVTHCAYLPSRSSQFVVLLPGQDLGGCFLVK